MDFQFLGGASEVGRLGMVLKKGPTSLLFDYGLLPRDPPQYPMPAPPPAGGGVSPPPPPPHLPGVVRGAPPPASRGRCPAPAARRCRGPPPGGLPEDRRRGRLRRPVR